MKFEDMKTAWSFSRLSAFENCPRRYHAEMVAKTVKQEERSAYQIEGDEVHDALEKRLIYNKPLPFNWAYLEPMCAKFDKAPGKKMGEQKLAINNRFQRVAYFASDVWARARMDFAIINGTSALLIDWKSGSRISTDFTQQRLGALMFFSAMPQLEKATIAYYWTQHSKPTSEVVTPASLVEFVGTLNERITRYEMAHRNHAFPPRKHPFCKSCRVNCEYNPNK